MDIIIREEQPTDINAIYAVEQDAFEHPDEADLVNRLRDVGAVWLSHVAVLDSEIAGHALYIDVQKMNQTKSRKSGASLAN